MNSHMHIVANDRIAAPARFTSREYREMIESGAFGDLGVELVEGELRKMMPSGWNHGEGLMTIGALLRAIYAPTGRRIGSDVMIEVEEGTTRAADISVVEAGFSGSKTLKGGDVILAVEIADTSLAEDLGPKALHYALCAIPNYWVVDLKTRSTYVMTEPTAEGYGKRAVCRFTEPLAVPGTDETITLD